MGFDWKHNDVIRLGPERDRVGLKLVLFCYDTIPVRYPHFLPVDLSESFKRYLVGVASNSDRVVAISQATRRDFLEVVGEAGASSPPVEVVTLGADPLSTHGAGYSPPPGLGDRPFVLCVGSIEPRKNHEVLYHVWERLAEANGDAVPTLVAAGNIGWGVGDLLHRIRANPHLKGRFLICNNLTDGEVWWLYKHCLFTVFPSHCEGWGLPVVESLTLGKPCICSNSDVAVEASQGLALTLDPLDVPAWVAAVKDLWLNGQARERLATQIAREFQPPTWEAFGDSLIRIARGVACGPAARSE